MTHHPDAPSGQPYSPPLPPAVSNGGAGGGGRKPLTVEHGKLFRIRPTGSPRWLKIARDALLSVAALLLIVSWVYAVVAVNRVGNALDEIGNGTSTSAPTGPGLPTCDYAGQFGCVDPGD